ncbi:MAG: CBS domain-containing protein [Candidatus Geothermarchaeota archaeon]
MDSYLPRRTSFINNIFVEELKSVDYLSVLKYSTHNLFLEKLFGLVMNMSNADEEIRARDIANTVIVKKNVKATLLDAYNEMLSNNSDFVVVVDDNERPLGLLFKSKILDNILTEAKDVRKTILKDVDLDPLVTVNADCNILDVIRILAKGKTGVIGVIHKKRLVGTISVADLAKQLPNLIEQIRRKFAFEKEALAIKRYSVGYCNECGAWSDKLVYKEGKYYCTDCIIDLYGYSC